MTQTEEESLSNKIIGDLRSRAVGAEERLGLLQRKFEDHKKYYIHYGWTIPMMIIASIVAILIAGATTRDSFKPIIRIEDKKALITCPDGSTQWVPVPQCKEVK